jgi:spermidine synthase
VKAPSFNSPAPPEENHTLPTPFVYREGQKVSLHFEIDAAQSIMNEDHPDSLVSNYTRLMMAVLLFVPDPEHVGCIGLGGGSIPKYCHQYLRQTRISVAEINPQVIALRDEFHVPRNGYRFGVFQVDGAEFVRANPNTFDVLMVDAFDHQGQPSHLCTSSFYQACSEALTPNGYMVANLCHEGKLKAISRMEQVFDQKVHCLRDSDGRNLIAIVGNNDASRSLPLLPARARVLESSHPLYFREMAYMLSDEPRLRHRSSEVI